MLTPLKVASGIVLGALAFATFPASAESVRYVSVSMLSSLDRVGLSGGPYTYGHSFTGDADFGRSSLGGALALGWEMPGGLRFESELGVYGTDTETFAGTFYFVARPGVSATVPRYTDASGTRHADVDGQRLLHARCRVGSSPMSALEPGWPVIASTPTCVVVRSAPMSGRRIRTSPWRGRRWSALQRS